MAGRKAGKQSKQKGSLRIDRTFEGVGRIVFASGFSDRVAFRQVNKALTAMKRAGRFDLLRAVKERRLRPRHLLAMTRKRGAGANLADISLAEVCFLEDAITQWKEQVVPRGPVNQAQPRPVTRHRQNQFNGLVRVLNQEPEATRGKVLLQDLPRLAKSYRDKCELEGKGPEWKHARAYLSSFVAKMVGMSSAVWTEIRDLGTISDGMERRVGLPMSPTTLRDLLSRVDSDLAKALRTMATTGMGPKEYFEDGWSVSEEGFIWIEGAKRDGRVRPVPLVCPPTPPPFSRSTFLRKLKIAQRDLAGIPNFQPYDLRRTFAVALLRAGVPSIRHAGYMGHGPRTVTHLYQLEVAISNERICELVEDGKRLQAYFALPTGD